MVSYERYDDLQARDGCVIGGVERQGPRCEPFIVFTPLPLQLFAAFPFKSGCVRKLL